MQELTFEQTEEVSGGEWSWRDMGATVGAACVAGGVAGAVPTVGVGFIPGCVGSGALAGITYSVYHLLK